MDDKDMREALRDKQYGGSSRSLSTPGCHHVMAVVGAELYFCHRETVVGSDRCLAHMDEVIAHLVSRLRSLPDSKKAQLVQKLEAVLHSLDETPKES